MRRSSVVGPLILIAIGGLFLARNLYPQLPLMDWMAMYWPYLLIGWGVLRLVEILIWAAAKKPLPMNGLSGGEWALIIVLCVAGSAVSAVWGRSSWLPRSSIRLGGIELFGERYEYPLSAQKEAGKTPHLVIESFRGNAHVIGGDTEEVKVTGRKTVQAMNQGDAEKANQDTPLELVAQGDQIIVRTNQGRLSANSRMTAEMEITVPKGSSVEAHGRRGDFDISNVAGRVEIDSDNAGVRLQDIGGDVRVDVRAGDLVKAQNVKGTVEVKGRNGDVDLENIDGAVTVTGSYVGVLQFRALAKPLRFEGVNSQLSVEKIPGQVRLALGDLTASNLVGPIRLTSRSRDVQIRDFTGELDLTLDRGDIELRPGQASLGRMEVHTGSGDIDLALPAAAKFDLRASTSRGEATNEYGVPLTVEQDRRRGSIHGAVGTGPLLSLTTDRGGITVRKTSVDDKAVTFPDIPSMPAAPKKK